MKGHPNLKSPLKLYCHAARRLLPFLYLLCLVPACIWVASFTKQTQGPEPGSTPGLFAHENRDDLELLMTEAITESKDSVLLVIYSLTDRKVIAALKQKSEEGVPVTVICDAKACPGIEKKLGPRVRLVKRFIKGLMHQKILVTDKHKTWIGSANMTAESLRHHSNLVTAFDSPEIALAVHSKAESYTDTERAGVFPPQTFDVGGQKVELSFLPDDTAAVDRMKELIRSAQKTIRIAMFTWTRTDLASEVIHAAKKGVKAEVMIDRHSGYGASAKIVSMLKKAGISVGLSRGEALLHHKFLYIDNSILVNGSANWTKAAFAQNDDCFIVLHKLDEEQQKAMDGLWQAIAVPSEY